jgi:hypothetical protein
MVRPLRIMRFILAEDFWVLDALSPAEWQLIRELPEVASGIRFGEKTRERLYPSPLSEEVIADESTLSQIEDWDELIRPELEESFARARFIVEKDLRNARTVPFSELVADELSDDEFEDEFEEAGFTVPTHEFYRVNVPHENTEPWYSTLNQARLLMNEEYDLADAEERILLRSLGAAAMDEERMVLFAQYELYSVVQSILVENLMGG